MTDNELREEGKKKDAAIEAAPELNRVETDTHGKSLQTKFNEEAQKPLSSSPLTLAIITGILGLLAAVVTNSVQSIFNLRLEREKYESTRKLEREKFESELIVKVIENQDPESSTKNLLFLVKAGLLSDPNKQIARLEDNPQNAPVVTTSTTGSEGVAPSSKSVDSLQPEVANIARQFLEQAKQQGIEVIVVRAYVSNKEQDALFAQGRTKPGTIVTGARGGQTSHNKGLAFDVVPVENGLPLWNDVEKFKKLGEIGKKLGLMWGGDFTSFKDYPHFEYRPQTVAASATPAP